MGRKVVVVCLRAVGVLAAACVGTEGAATLVLWNMRPHSMPSVLLLFASQHLRLR